MPMTSSFLRKNGCAAVDEPPAGHGNDAFAVSRTLGSSLNQRDGMGAIFSAIFSAGQKRFSRFFVCIAFIFKRERCTDRRRSRGATRDTTCRGRIWAGLRPLRTLHRRAKSPAARRIRLPFRRVFPASVMVRTHGSRLSGILYCRARSGTGIYGRNIVGVFGEVHNFLADAHIVRTDGVNPKMPWKCAPHTFADGWLCKKFPVQHGRTGIVVRVRK